ncbi:hypothetical protein [Flavobacterium gelatinilyticum]|uniref:hypothetical protein n=1 Tax=Flavobacterium gelatinilyticum TaxID=3003260 RepID=UPI00248130CE|nr:hypothetical protein [Flavobacterium gelatinilyticum]
MNKLFFLSVLLSMCFSCINNKSEAITNVDKNKIKNQNLKRQDSVNLNNTRWECAISDDCVNKYEFKANNKFILHSCEMEDDYFGDYYFRNDTLFIDQKGSLNDNELPEGSTERAERKLYELIIVDNKLKHLYVSDWVKGKWVRSNFQFDNLYLYSKVD